MFSLRGKLLSFLACGAVIFGAAPAFASLSCEASFSPTGDLKPKDVLGSALTPDSLERTRKAAALLRRFEAIDINREFSEADLRLLVSDLQQLRFGKTTARRYNRLATADYVTARMTREIQAELGARGLIAFYRERGLLVTESRLKTKIRLLLRSPKAKLLATTLWIPTLFTHRPFFFLPYSDRFQITPAQFETLLLQGTESSAGREVMGRLGDLATDQKKRDTFVRWFNRAAFVATVVIITYYVTKEEDERAKARGDALLADVAAKNAQIEARGEPDTKEDLRYDAIVISLSDKAGRDLNEDELNLVCVQIPAPHRCH